MIRGALRWPGKAKSTDRFLRHGDASCDVSKLTVDGKLIDDADDYSSDRAPLTAHDLAGRGSLIEDENRVALAGIHDINGDRVAGGVAVDILGEFEVRIVGGLEEEEIVGAVLVAVSAGEDRQHIELLTGELEHFQYDTFVARFRKEAQAAANLSHPNIVSIYDWGEYGDTYYMVMELIEGRTLREILKSEGSLLPRRAAEIAAETAAALTVAHPTIPRSQRRRRPGPAWARRGRADSRPPSRRHGLPGKPHG